MKRIKLYEEFNSEDIDGVKEISGETENQYTIKKIKKILKRNSEKLNKNFHVEQNKYVIPRKFSYIWGEYNNGLVTGLFVNFYQLDNDDDNCFMNIVDNRENSLKMIKHKYFKMAMFPSSINSNLKLKFYNIENALKFLNDCNIQIKQNLHEEFNQDNIENPYIDPAVGDTVYINYKIPGGNKDHVPTPVKIISLKGTGKQRAFIASHNVELSAFKNAPNLAINKSDIIGPHKGVSTPTGSGFISSKPSINTGVNQISNDMAL